MRVDAYLDRIGYAGPLAPTADVLRGLHRAHMLSVPFENLDIHVGKPIILNHEAFFEKIVGRRRGGFCYELNGLFGALLVELGFPVTMLSARVVAGGVPGPEFDHMTLLVPLDERWLADVGFGDSFREPLMLDEARDQIDEAGAFRLTSSGEEWTLWKRLPNLEWERQYLFTLQPHPIEHYAGMCRYHQTSPDSPFTRRRICSVATPTGRITLTDDRLIITNEGNKEETPVLPEEFETELRKHFGILLGGQGT